MDDKTKKKMFKFLNKNIPKKDCILCGAKKWTVSDSLWEVESFSPDEFNLGNKIPLVTLTCNNCGNTHFLNAIIAGLVPKPDGEGEGDE